MATVSTAARPAFLRLLLAIAFLTLVDMADASAQTLPWRGHTMSRDGLFRVTRARWGGGVTSTGASVLIPLIENAPAIIGAATGRGTDEVVSSRAPSRAPWAGWEVYAAEQKRATDLLERLDRLAGGQSPVSPLPNDGRPKLNIDQVREQFGDQASPWPGSANQ